MSAIQVKLALFHIEYLQNVIVSYDQHQQYQQGEANEVDEILLDGVNRTPSDFLPDQKENAAAV